MRYHPTIRISGSDIPAEAVEDRFLQLPEKMPRRHQILYRCQETHREIYF